MTTPTAAFCRGALSRFSFLPVNPLPFSPISIRPSPLSQHVPARTTHSQLQTRRMLALGTDLSSESEIKGEIFSFREKEFLPRMRIFIPSYFLLPFNERISRTDAENDRHWKNRAQRSSYSSRPRSSSLPLLPFFHFLLFSPFRSPVLLHLPFVVFVTMKPTRVHTFIS